MIWLFRLIFLFLMGYLGATVETAPVAGFAIGFVLVVVEYFMFERLVKNLYSILFGLAVGIAIGHILLQLAKTLLEYLPRAEQAVGKDLFPFDTMIVLVCGYIGVAISLKYLARFKAVLPFIHVRQEMHGSNQVVIDTSALIDGRVVELVEKNLFDYHLLVPRYVSVELQQVADSSDKSKRERGRHGLDNLNNLKKNPLADLEFIEERIPQGFSVDEAIVALAKQRNAKVLTTDYNLNKFAQVQGVAVINLNELASVLRTANLPGDQLRLKIVKRGENEGQGVGYLSDGTMVVVENASRRIGNVEDIEVQSVIQTSAGKMLFARIIS